MSEIIMSEMVTMSRQDFDELKRKADAYDGLWNGAHVHKYDSDVGIEIGVAAIHSKVAKPGQPVATLYCMCGQFETYSLTK